MMVNTHALLAGIAKTPELALEAEEAKQLAIGYANVARHYNWVVNEKSADWYNLITCIGAVYGSKFMAIKLRRAQQKTKAPDIKPFAQPKREATPSDPKPAPPASPLRPSPVPAMEPAEPDYADNTLDG